MNKPHLRILAHEKFEDAKLLFEFSRYSNSFYLFGYVVECLLKARISDSFLAGFIPDKRMVNDIYAHDLGKLISLANLSDELSAACKENVLFDHYWSVVREWSEAKRYDIIPASQAMSMYNVMTDRKEGVHAWLSPRCS